MSETETEMKEATEQIRVFKEIFRVSPEFGSAINMVEEVRTVCRKPVRIL